MGVDTLVSTVTVIVRARSPVEGAPTSAALTRADTVR
jgi:hypothetical protein